MTSRQVCPNQLVLWHLTISLLQALLLSHPFPLTRDTQQFAFKYKLSKDRRPALRKLTTQEFGIEIQGGEHSSVRLISARTVLLRVFTFGVGYRRQGYNGGIPSPPSRVGTREETAVTTVRGLRPLGRPPNTEETEARGRGQSST